MGTGGPLQPDFVRYRHGDAKPSVSRDVDTADLIRVGSWVHRDVGDADKIKSAASIVDIGGGGPATLAAAQELFHDQSLGVASQRSLVGETRPIRFNTAAIHEFKAVSAIYRKGALLGLSSSGLASDDLLPDTMVAVADADLAVAKVFDDSPDTRTGVLVEIIPVITSPHAGVQDPA